MSYLEKFCKADAIYIAEYGIGYMEPDPDCPVGNVWNSGAVLTPSDPAYAGEVEDEVLDLARGNATIAIMPQITNGNLYDGMSNGIHCPTDCKTVDVVKDQARLQAVNDCLSQDDLLGQCAGENDPDLLDVAAQKRGDMLTCELETRMLCTAFGIMAAALANPDINIVVDLIGDPPTLSDGTTGLTDYNLAAAICAMDNSGIGDIIVVKKRDWDLLKLAGWAPYCCGDQGQVENQVPAGLLGPNGERIVPANKKASQMMTTPDGVCVAIVMRNNSFRYADGSIPRTRKAYQNFQAFEATKDRCKGWILDIYHRFVLDPCGWSWVEPDPKLGSCEFPDCGLLQSAASWEYVAPIENDCGADKSCFGFILYEGGKVGAAKKAG